MSLARRRPDRVAGCRRGGRGGVEAAPQVIGDAGQRVRRTLYRHLFGAVPCDKREYQSFGVAAQELATRQHVLPA